jgi:hypothetical protein
MIWEFCCLISYLYVYMAKFNAITIGPKLAKLSLEINLKKKESLNDTYNTNVVL